MTTTSKLKIKKKPNTQIAHLSLYAQKGKQSKLNPTQTKINEFV